MLIQFQTPISRPPFPSPLRADEIVDIRDWRKGSIASVMIEFARCHIIKVPHKTLFPFSLSLGREYPKGERGLERDLGQTTLCLTPTFIVVR